MGTSRGRYFRLRGFPRDKEIGMDGFIKVGDGLVEIKADAKIERYKDEEIVK